MTGFHSELFIDSAVTLAALVGRIEARIGSRQCWQPRRLENIVKCYIEMKCHQLESCLLPSDVL